MNLKKLNEKALELAPWVSDRRRALHRIPEPGFAEYETAALVRQTLDGLGIPWTAERTWTIGTIRGGRPGPTVALRAEIDALPVTEPEGCPFRSTHEGWMHACGHDMHTAIQLGAAKLLNAMRDALAGDVRLLFQPAEETVGGAAPMVQAGAMDGVDAVYGLHVQPYMLVGDMDTRPGCLNGSTDEVVITVKGVSGHAARPNECVDAIVCAAQIVCALQTVISRSVTPLKPAVLSLGMIHGGEAENVICDRVTLRGTLRATDPALRAFLKMRVREVCAGVAAACRAECEVEIVDGYMPLMNHPAETERVLRLSRALLGAEHTHVREDPSMGGQDISYFVAEAPGAFWHLGCSASLPAPSLHSRDLVPDERCLPIGVTMECALVLDRMGLLEV